jgi:hypothetical protein
VAVAEEVVVAAVMVAVVDTWAVEVGSEEGTATEDTVVATVGDMAEDTVMVDMADMAGAATEGLALVTEHTTHRATTTPSRRATTPPSVMGIPWDTRIQPTGSSGDDSANHHESTNTAHPSIMGGFHCFRVSGFSLYFSVGGRRKTNSPARKLPLTAYLLSGVNENDRAFRQFSYL